MTLNSKFCCDLDRSDLKLAPNTSSCYADYLGHTNNLNPTKYHDNAATVVYVYMEQSDGRTTRPLQYMFTQNNFQGA